MYFDNVITSIGNDGALLIECGGMNDGDYGVEPWSRGLCAYTNKTGCWQKYDRDAELILVSFRYMADVDLVIHRFISEIPVEVCKAVKDIRYLQLSLLQAAENSRYFRDLLISTPFLAWMLMDHAMKHDWPDSQIDTISQRKQTIILNEISGVTEKSYIRLLRSIQLDDGTEEELGLILKSMRPDIKISLQHTAKVPVNVLKFLIKVSVLPSSKLIHYFINFSFPKSTDSQHKFSYLTMLWHDTEKLGSDLQISNANERLKACRKLQEIFKLHDSWVARLNENRPVADEDIIFPDPPIPDTSTIIGIRSYVDLIEEGQEMEHCVGIMYDQVISGESYMYRVFEPQRATLKINRCFGQDNESCPTWAEWEIDEFRLKNNVLPGEVAYDVVEKWLDNYSTELHLIEDPDLYRKVKWGGE